MNNLVSIIMPTYKGSKIIERSLLSLLNQSYSNIEIIIVDDNGKLTQEQLLTQKAIEKYFVDTRIKYIVHDVNKNGSCARNTGLKHCCGEFICFLDDDDCFAINKIEKQVEEFDNSSKDVGLVYTGVREIYSQNSFVDRIPKDSNDFVRDYLLGRLFVCSSSIMVRKQFVDMISGWDESFVRHQDIEFIVRLTSICKVKCIFESLVLKYREDRNLPNNPYKVEKYRMYFLQKMDTYIKQFDKKTQRNIYYFHYLQIGKAFLKKGKVFKSLKYAFKSKRPFQMIFIYTQDAIKYIKRRNKNDKQ